MIIGDRLRTIRQKKRLTHADIERRCGISKTQVSRIENGHSVTSVVELEEIAAALEVPIHELFYDPSKGAPRFEQLSVSRRSDEPAGGFGEKTGVFARLRTRLSKLH
jgi:transcriptional regulator with XRE-family HTH domain